jgi:hypothetical protein
VKTQQVGWLEDRLLQGIAERATEGPSVAQDELEAPRVSVGAAQPAGVAPVELITQIEADRRRPVLYRTVRPIGEPTGAWYLVLFTLFLMGGVIGPNPKQHGGMLGSYRPMPYQSTLWIIVIIVGFALCLTGWFTIPPR